MSFIFRIFFFIFLACLFLNLFAAETPIQIYISTLGKDTWSGKLPAPDGQSRDGPFATIARARDAVRDLKKNGLKHPVFIKLRQGIYQQTETLLFSAVDSGSEKFPVTYGAYGNEQVVISGGINISGWQEFTINGKFCWIADLPENAANLGPFQELFVNGDRRPRTRLPQTGFYRYALIPDSTLSSGISQGQSSMFFMPGQFNASWKNLADIEVVTFGRIAESHQYIKSIDSAKNLITFTSKSISNMYDKKDSLARFFIENIFDALGEPGTWYLDSSANRVYYIPQMGEQLETSTFTVPRLRCVVKIAGTTSGPVPHHIFFENINFQYAEAPYSRNFAGSAQAASEVPGAIILDRANNCTFYRCNFSALGTYGLEISGSSQNNRIIGCEFSDLGAGGIKIGDNSEKTMVSNCSIHDGGIIYPSAVGIWIGTSAHNRILNNHIYNLHNSGISCGWTKDYTPTITIDNRIEYNHIHDIGSNLLNYLGAIYTVGLQPGTVINHNLIHNVFNYRYSASGIFLDQGSSEILVENNICFMTQSAGITQSTGKDNLIRNNIFAFARELPVYRSKEEEHNSFLFEKNIVYYDSDNEIIGGQRNSTTFSHIRVDDNVYWHNGKPITFNRMKLKDWQLLGNDTRSLVEDPLFSNPASNDFSLKSNSPALALGFKPIDILNIGPQPADSFPVHFSNWKNDTIELRPIISSQFEKIDSIPFSHTALSGKVRLTLKNKGNAPATGHINVRLLPDKAGIVSGKKTFDFTLLPGQRRSEIYSVSPIDGIDEIAIITEPSGDAVIPTCLYVQNRALKTWNIKNIGDSTSASDLSSQFENEPPHQFNYIGKPVAQINCARTNTGLGLCFIVFDAKPEIDTSEWWRKSCVELYFKGVESKTITQIVVLPQKTDSVGNIIFCTNGMPDKQRQVPMHISFSSKGYEISMVLPFAYINVESGDRELLFDIAISSRNTIKDDYLYKSYCNSLIPIRLNPERMGTMVLK